MVLAHELGHLSREHGRFGSWVYRIRVTWMRLTERLEAERHWGYTVFDWFLKRWAPYFNAYSFVLARAHEYEADRFAARIAGRDHLAAALVALEVHGALLDRRYWPSVFQRAETSLEPPGAVLEGLALALRAGPPGPDAARWLRAALGTRTGLGDTHPSLSDCLAALGVAPPDRPPASVTGPTAADRYLGALAARAGQALEERWRAGVAEFWRDRHQYLKQARERLNGLEREATGAPLEAVWERAALTLELEGWEAAMPRLRDVLALDPHHAAANFELGRLQLALDDANGASHVERAMARDPSAAAAGHELLAEFYERHGQKEEAGRHRLSSWEEGDHLVLAQAERGGVSEQDTFLAHALPPEAIAAAQAALAGIPEVRAAYLVRKALQHLPDRPLYVLGVDVVGGWYKLRMPSKDQAVLDRVVSEVPVPGQWLAVVLNEQTKGIAKKLKADPGALIFRR